MKVQSIEATAIGNEFVVTFSYEFGCTVSYTQKIFNPELIDLL